MALSSVSVDLINKASPVNNDYSIGNRLQYMTTAGYLASGTLQGVTITSGDMTDASIDFKAGAANTTIESTALTTAYQIFKGGVYSWRASGGKAIRVSTDAPVGCSLMISNLSTGASGVVCFSTNGTVGLCGAGSTYGTTAGASGCFGTLAALKSAHVVHTSAGHWQTMSGTGSWATFSTVQTASA